ncbi:hypothetical protein POV27_14415 [Aureisphaera galaxeae]|uniref:hypothetical protein n=1 Tax=Aureisphaera galaxeae TaxID=1538023 RepID=UPI002350CF21|nr:hypothetical protein [Aureisphaera galaxeae]MDC8005252.1 hypothetical protein [Aureisphaera galaxeae]
MKKVVLICTAAVFTTAFFSCKSDSKNDPETTTHEMEVVAEIPNEEIAMASSSELNAEADVQYLYVTAPSGLTLREYGNLHSTKLARMPYGTKVKVVQTEDNPTMNVKGIKGGMDEVEFNHKKGFAFNGYLSKYFPPERDITVKGYASELNALFPDVVYTENTGGTVSNPENTESITLPGSEWHEAFFTAQRLFDFPKEFTFPNAKGKNSETIFDGKPKKGIWISQLEVTRNDNELEKIEYVYGSEKFDSKVTIEAVAGGMKISKTEVVK